MSDPIWRPDAARVAQSNLSRFLRARATELSEPTYAALHAWSIDARDVFWSSLWDFCDVVAERKGDEILVDGDRMPGATWFPEARLNFAENLMRTRGRDAAIIFRNERGERRELDWDELRRHVAVVAAELRKLGVAPGDRVAGLLPNLPETVIAMLATTSLGAVWSSCSPDFGPKGVLERFGQIDPVVLIGVDGYSYGGKVFDCRAQLSAIAESLPSLRRVWIVEYAKLGRPRDIDAFPIPAGPDPALEFAQLGFDHPAYILYTSGTTGVPKSIVHGAGGTLLQHLKEHVLHTDLKPRDRIFFFTTCGWMMWHWLVSALASSATVVLYDGAPLHPDPGALWRLVDEERIRIFGTSAKYLSALEKSGYRPIDAHALTTLDCLLTTGSPLSIGSFEFVYRDVKQDVQLSSISGGTDIISCFALGNPLLPVYRGELQCLGLGMAVEVFDDAGRPVRGERGELVCTAAFPSMPVAFWNDPGGEKYFNAYFARFPGVWCHGDYAELTENGGLVMYGRSDTVLNPGGVRIGTAEIYRVVDELPEVFESVVVGQEWEDDTRIVLFVRLQPGCELDDALRARIRQALREQASPRHVPARILAVADIPRTRSGKISEVAVRETIHGRPVENIAALANPGALDAFADRPELRT